MNMTREVRELRKKLITSTNIGTLFGLNPHQSLYHLWDEKKNGEVINIDNEYMKAGRKLEPVIAEMIQEREGWKLYPFKDFIKNEQYRIGSSFDYKAETDVECAIIEIKNVGYTTYKKDWFNEGIETPPAQYQLQVQTQMFISGIHKAYIGAFVGGNRLLDLFEIKYDNLKIVEILNEVRKFWESIDKNIQPPQEDEPNTKLQSTMFHDVTKDKVIEADDKLKGLILEYDKENSMKLYCEKKVKSLKAEIRPLIGDAQIIKCGSHTLTCTKVKDSYAKEDKIIKKGDLTRKGSITFKIKEVKNGI